MAYKNVRMREKVEKNEAIDLKNNRRTSEGYYILESFDPGDEMDYCDTSTDSWIWSIGQRYSDGVILASTSNVFYQNPDYNCLFLR